MPIDLTGLPDKQEDQDNENIDLTGLPDNNASILRTQYRTDPTNPKQEAEVYDISKRTQLPPQTVRSDLPKAKRIADEPDWEALQREAPNLAKKMRENPELFRVAKGSVNELSMFEKALKVLGVQGLAEMTFRAPEMIKRNLMTLGRDNPMQQLYRRAILDNPAYADLKAAGRLPEEASEFVLDNPLMEQLNRPIEFSSTVADAISEQMAYEGQSTELGRYIGETMERANTATMAALNGDFEELGDLVTDKSAMGVIVGQGFASLMIALASRGSIVPIMLMESGEAASEIARLEKETGVKISDEDYLLATTMKGIIGGYLERTGAGGFAFDKADGLLSGLMRILSSAGGEAGTEFGQALTGNVAKLLTYDPDANPAEDLLSSTLAGFGLGVGVQSSTETVNAIGTGIDASRKKKLTEKYKQLSDADRNKPIIDAMLKEVRESQLRDLSPDAFEEAIEAIAEDSGTEEVFFDADKLKDYYAQQDLPIEDALADVPEVLEQMDEVLATGGGDVVVPLAKVLRHMAHRPEDVELANHIRFAPDALSTAEANEYRESKMQDEISEEAERIIQKRADDDADVQQAKGIEDALFAQLEQANRFKSDVNRTYAKFAANTYLVFGVRAGLTPEEMAKRYPVNIDAVTAKGPSLTLFKQLEQDAFKVIKSNDGTRFAVIGNEDGKEVARIEVERRGTDRMQITEARVDTDKRGQRVGQQLIEQAYALAQEEGRTLVSDVVVSALQLRAYEALRRRGWTIEYSEPDRVADMLDLASEAESLGKPIAAIGVGSTVAETPVVSKIEAPLGQDTQPQRPFAPLPKAQEAARKYAEKAGIEYQETDEYLPLDEDRSRRIAAEFDVLEHNPDDPLVKAAYRAMIDETLAQFEAILETGLQIEFITGEDPYQTPHDAVRDVHENNRLYVFSTRDGFGSDETVDVNDNPLLEETEYEISGQKALANDIFRVVHDYFGHIKNGNGFRAMGEDNAWQAHAPMYSPLARRALTTETRGQNSWVNYGPHGDGNRTASGADTIYADQKVGLLPLWVSEEGRLHGKRKTGSTSDGRVRPPVRADGRIELTHYGKRGIERIDPKYQTSIHKEGGRTNRIPRSYYGIAPGSENGYRVEAFLRGRQRLTTSIAAELLYDYQADPENLKDPDGDINVTEQNIYDAGYSGFWVNHPQRGLMALSFDPLPVEEPQGSFFQQDNDTPLNRAQKNNIGLFSAVEQAVKDMKLQSWNKKAANKLFTEQDAKTLGELRGKVMRDVQAELEAAGLTTAIDDRVKAYGVNSKLLAIKNFFDNATEEEIADPANAKGWGQDVIDAVAGGMTKEKVNAELQTHALKLDEANRNRKKANAIREKYFEDGAGERVPEIHKIRKLEQRRRAKEVGGLASGKEIWQKVSKMPGVKKEELETLGLEAFLLAGDKFGRDEVINFVRNNGVNIVEVTGVMEEGSVDEDDITWNEHIDDNSENWTHRVDDYIYDFDRIDFVSEFDSENLDTHWVFDHKKWIENNYEDILDALGLADKRLPGQTDFMVGGEGDIGPYDDIQSLLLTAIEYEDHLDIQVEDTVRELMRSDFEEAAEKAAAEEYMDNPYIRYTSEELGNVEIYGNDDVGYSVNGEYHDIYSLSEAQIQAIDIARDRGDFIDSDSELGTRWSEYIYDADSETRETYRERKLTLPDNPGAEFHEDAHFPDANIVTFLRETDRELAISSEQFEVTPKIHHQKESGQIRVRGFPRYLAAGYYIFDTFEDGSVWSVSTTFDTQERAERRLQHWNTQSRRKTAHTYMVDEQQSDWHQSGRQVGYRDEDFDRNEAAARANAVQEPLDESLRNLYDDTLSRAVELNINFDADRILLSDPRIEATHEVQSANETGENIDQLLYDTLGVNKHNFVQMAWQILRGRKPEPSDSEFITNVSQDVRFDFVEKILNESDLDLADLQQKVAEYDEIDRQMIAYREGVTDAPFKGNAWLELGLRRAIVNAVENGYEAFAWADGEMLVDRWNDHARALYENQYDKKMPSIVKKITKQTPKHLTWDGEEQGGDLPEITILQLTAEDIENNRRPPRPTSAGEIFVEGNYYWEIDWNSGGRVATSMTASRGQFATEEEAWRAARNYAAEHGDNEIGYWIVPITDELRERIKAEGLPLFQDKTRGAFTPSTKTITLLEDANLSTFLHEFGHWQLEVLADLASQHGGSAEIKQDMQTVLDWFGVEDVNAWNNLSLEEKRPHHEQFARGFEKYLFTGKAPNPELNNIFARIREWMIRTYKSITELNVTLTPEVTEVFDRLVATEEQIREAEEMQGYRRLFKSEEESGMSPAEWRRYQNEAEKPTEDAQRDLQNRALRDMQWLRNARSRELKALQAQAKEKRAAIRDEVEAEVMAEPIQQAITFLKTGQVTVPGKEEIKVEKGHRLANDALLEMYPETALGNRDWRALPQGRYGLRGKEGLHPQVVAEVFGFESADALVAELLAAENAKDKIEGITDQRMLEQHGELSSPEALEIAVDEAIHNEARTKLIATELVALEKATGKKRLLLRAAKQYAKDAIGNMEVRNLKKTNRYSVAERKAAREAELELRRGNREQAARHRRSQLISNLLYREALNANNEVPKMLRLFKKFDKPGVRKNLDQEYLDQIDQLLERYDLRQSQSQHQIDRRVSLNNWVTAQRETDAGFDPAIDPRLLNEAARTHYTRLTLNEMRGLYDSIRSIEHIARWKNKLLTAKDKREFKARMEMVNKSIEDNATKDIEEHMENNSPLRKLADGWHEWFAMHRKLGSIVRTMDGLKDGGPVWELLLRPANERSDYETVEHEKATTALNDILRPVYSQGRMNKLIDIPGTDKRITIEGRFVMLLNMGNETNYDRLVTGELANGWTEADFEAVKNSASKEEWDAVQGVWDFINTYWAEIAAKETRITGVAPEKVDASPIETPHGTYRGGYFPITYNVKRSRKSAANTANELLVQKLKGNYSAATTRRGHTKARGESGTGPLRYDMGVITEHVSNVIHDLAWHEWAIDANRIARDPGFEQVVRKHYGDPIVKLINHTIEDIVIGDVPAKNTWERMVNHLRIGSTIVGLGYSVFTMALQPFGLAQSIVRIGPQHVLKGMGRWLGSARNMEDSMGWVYENSDFMRLRYKTMMREMDEVLNQVRGEKLTKLKASYFVLIAKGQLIADMPTWIGQYHKSMEGGADHEKSVQLADQAVKDSQGSGLGMDRAEIQRGGPLLKIFTNFYSYFNATFNLLAESKSQTNFKKPKDVALFTVDFLLLTAVPATMAAIAREAIYELTGGGDDEERDAEELALWLARENLSYMSGLMVGTREISGALQGYYGYTGPAGLRFFGEFGKLLAQTGQGEVDEAFLKSLNQVGGLVFHYPAAQVERTAEGMLELAEGETANPLVLLSGAE